MVVMDWIRKLTDIIMPLEPPNEEEEEIKETKKAETKIEEAKPAQTEKFVQPAQNEIKSTGGLGHNFGGGTMSFTRNGGMVSTAESGVTSMGGVRYEAYSSDTTEVKPSLAVVKTPQLTMRIYAPTKYDDQVKQIADDLLKNKAVIVNFEGVDDIEQQRIGDFVIGAVYMINGRAEMVSNKIILYVPSGVEYETAAMAHTQMRRYN